MESSILPVNFRSISVVVRRVVSILLDRDLRVLAARGRPVVPILHDGHVVLCGRRGGHRRVLVVIARGHNLGRGHSGRVCALHDFGYCSTAVVL